MPGQAGGRIPSSLGDISHCSLQIFQLMSPTHIVEGNWLYLTFTDLDVNCILKYAFHVDIQTKLMFDRESVYSDLFNLTLKVHPLSWNPHHAGKHLNLTQRQKGSTVVSRRIGVWPTHHPTLVPDTE